MKPYFLKISFIRSRKDSPSLRRSLINQHVSLLGLFLNLFTGAFLDSRFLFFVICNFLLLSDVFVNFFNLFVFVLNQYLPLWSKSFRNRFWQLGVDCFIICLEKGSLTTSWANNNNLITVFCFRSLKGQYLTIFPVVWVLIFDSRFHLQPEFSGNQRWSDFLYRPQ